MTSFAYPQMRQPARTAGLDFLVELPASEDHFRDDVIAGLGSRPRGLTPKYFYDEAGARIFEEITATPEYYVTRAETALLERNAGEIAGMAGVGASLIEPGSGAARKARILLKAFDRSTEYVLFDISREQLEKVGGEIAREFPDMRIGAVAGDFTKAWPPASEMFHGSGKRICFFPGGTLGNFEPARQRELLESFRTVLRPGDALLLGVDTIKDAAILDAAYNDSAGITARFNLNLLDRMRRDLGAAIDTDAFEHRAFFVPARARIEMHLLAMRDTVIELGTERFEIAHGETIHTENSYKFDALRLERLAEDTGFSVRQVWGGEADMFMLAWLSA